MQIRILTSAWAMFWFGYEALVFTAAIFAGIIVFRVRTQAPEGNWLTCFRERMIRCSTKRESPKAGAIAGADVHSSRFLPT